MRTRQFPSLGLAAARFNSAAANLWMFRGNKAQSKLQKHSYFLCSVFSRFAESKRLRQLVRLSLRDKCREISQIVQGIPCHLPALNRERSDRWSIDALKRIVVATRQLTKRKTYVTILSSAKERHITGKLLWNCHESDIGIQRTARINRVDKWGPIHESLEFQQATQIWAIPTILETGRCFDCREMISVSVTRIRNLSATWVLQEKNPAPSEGSVWSDVIWLSGWERVMAAIGHLPDEKEMPMSVANHFGDWDEGGYRGKTYLHL